MVDFSVVSGICLRRQKKSEVNITEAMAFALGCIGLRLRDFEALTPMEYSTVASQWLEMEEGRQRRQLEAARLTGWLALSPHLRRGSKLENVCRFAWDTQPAAKKSKSVRPTASDVERIKKKYNSAQ